METYKSRLSDVFNGHKNSEDIFRKQSKQHYPATELAYIMRFIDGEVGLKDLFSDENLQLIKKL